MGYRNCFLVHRHTLYRGVYRERYHSKQASDLIPYQEITGCDIHYTVHRYILSVKTGIFHVSGQKVVHTEFQNGLQFPKSKKIGSKWHRKF